MILLSLITIYTFHYLIFYIMSSNSKQKIKSSNKQNYFQWKKEHILSLIEVLRKSIGNKGLNYYDKYQGGSKTTTPKKITAK